ncbi:MAG: hypothetical protein IIC00_16950 [Planctomycetes bacterium]|nr:hypothetical protein [Planctomycetota bacterium]
MTNRLTCANPKIYPVIKHERLEGDVRFTAKPIQQRLEVEAEVETEPEPKAEAVPQKPRFGTLLAGIIGATAKV